MRVTLSKRDNDLPKGWHRVRPLHSEDKPISAIPQHGRRQNDFLPNDLSFQ